MELIIDIEDKKIEDIPLKTLVYSLDEPERTILIMYFFERATFKEISEILHIPQSTIKTRYYNILFLLYFLTYLIIQLFLLK